MKRWNEGYKYALPVILAVMLIFGTAGNCFASAGVLLMVQGKVTVDAKNGSQPAKTGSPLMPGDTVTSRGGQVTVLLSNGTLRSVKPGGKLVIPSPSAGEKGEKLLSRLVDTVRETARKGRGPTIKGMVRGQGEILSIYPYNSVVEKEALRFEWEPLKGGGDAEVVIKAHQPPYRHSIPAKAGGNRIGFPANAPPMTAGIRYYWKVKTAETGSTPIRQSKLRWFAILSSDRSTSLAGELSHIRKLAAVGSKDRVLLEANLLIGYHLYHRAEKLLKNAIEATPADPGLKELLAGVYTEMKNAEAVEKLK